MWNVGGFQRNPSYVTYLSNMVGIEPINCTMFMLALLSENAVFPHSGA